MNSKRVILIAGNKGSGKNTFASVLRGVRTDCGFKIYSEHDPPRFTFPISEYHEFSFAGVLKKKVADILNMTVDELDSMKDKPLPDCSAYTWFGEKPAGTPTGRDILIDEALRVRTNDPSFYVRTVYEELKEVDGVSLITDWRYKNELEYLQQFVDVVTVRVESNFAPPAFVPSERDLDDLSFDFICHRSEESIEAPSDYLYFSQI